MILYFDTSALVKLYFQEPGSLSVRSLYSRAERIATSAIAGAELASAMQRRVRESSLEKAVADRVWRDWLARSQEFFEVPLPSGSSTIATQVFTLCSKYPLRASDAIHVASALEVARHHFPGDAFLLLTSDENLKKAATDEGLPCEDLRK